MTVFRDNLTPSDLLEKYILPKIAFEPNTGCWIWMGHLHKGGHGTTSVPLLLEKKWRTVSVNRYLYQVVKGPIRRGLWVVNSCATKFCSNPDHLRLITAKKRLHQAQAWKRLTDRTECRKGHPYTPENTITTHRGARQCRICQNEHARNHTAKKRAEDQARFRDLLDIIELSEKLSRAPQKFYVYHLVDPFTGAVFYVGKGCGARVFQHEKDLLGGMSVNQEKDRVLHSIIARGGEVHFSIVQRNMSESRALWLEQMEIDRIGLDNLTNKFCGTIPGKYRKIMQTQIAA